MKKNSKIILNLSIITALLATGAQFYTNYKINQSLQQFPYYFSDKFVIYVQQTQQNFFSRELVFSVQTPSKPEKSEIIKTKLTALPFAILAKSELPDTVIRKLNEKLNITIDDNIINSRFSVVGNYLQSTMETKFRDFTNVNQLLTTELNFASKTKFVEIHTALTGFNYDSVTEFGKLNGDYLLQPIGDHRYDLIQANMNLDNLKWINGENNKFSFNKINYLFNKSFNEQTYDLTAELKYDNLDYNDSKIITQGFSANVKQQGIPNSLNFYEKIKQLDNKEITIEDIIRLGLDYLFDNQKAEWNINLKKLSNQLSDKNNIELNDIAFGININHQDNQKTQISNHLKINEIKTQQLDFMLKGLSFENNISDLNFNDYLLMAKQYVFDENGKFVLTNEDSFYKKDNPEFIKVLNILAKNYQAKTSYVIKLDNLSMSDNIQLNNLVIKYNDEATSTDQMLADLSANLDQLQIKAGNISFNKLQLDMPIIIGPKSDLYPIYYCFNNIFSLTCANNISQKTSEKFISQALAQFYMNINDAKFKVALDTLPKSAGEQWISGEVNAVVESIPDKKRADLLTLGDKLDNSEIKAKLNISTKLIDDMFSNEPNEIAQLKLASPYWKQLAYLIKPKGALNPYFVLNNENYSSDYYQKGEKVMINNKPIEQYIQQQEQ